MQVEVVVHGVIVGKVRVLVAFHVVLDAVFDPLDLLCLDVAVLERSMQQIQLGLMPLISLDRLFQLCYPLRLGVVSLLRLLYVGMQRLDFGLDGLYLPLQLLVHLLQELNHLHLLLVLGIDLGR